MESVFEQRSMPEPNTGCWLWTGCTATGKAGYRKPILKRGGKYLSAARESWKAANGNPELRKDQFVLHRCNVSECVNPAHLYLGTAQDNADDGIRNEKWGKRLKNDVREEIVRRFAMGETARQISVAMGLLFNTVKNYR
jgi:hypothetical protein